MYCDKDDINNLELTEKQMIQLTDDDNQNQVDDNKVNAAIERAQAEIDKYVGSRYDVPFADGSVPDLVKGWCATLAAWYMYRNGIAPALLKSRYKGVKANLEMVRDGKVEIPGTSPSDTGGSLPASTSDGQGHQFIKGDFDDDGNQVTPGTMDVW